MPQWFDSQAEVQVRLKTGLIIGFGVGYVLGSKAGRERYEQIKSVAGRIAETDTAQQVFSKGAAVADLGATRAKQVVGEGMATAAEKIRERAGG
jgi:hypothetical protein